MQIFLSYAASVIENSVYYNRCKVILPSRRAATYFKNLCWKIKDNVFSIEEFIIDCYKHKGEILDTTDVLLNFYDALRNEYKQEDINFEEFASWAFTAIDDFNAIDSSLADAKDLYSFLNDSKALELWNPEQPELTEIQKKYLSFFKSQFKNYDILNAHLESLSKANIGKANKWLSNNILDVINSDMLFVVGFNAFSNAETSMFKKLNNANKLEFIWDTDSFYLNDINHEAGYFMRANMNTFYGESDKLFNRIISNFASIEKNIQIIGAAKMVPQAKLLNKILNDLNCEDWSNTAIVLANENMLPVVLNSLPNKIKNVNVSMSYTLKNSQSAQWIINYISIFCSIKNETENSLRYYFKTFIDFFSQSFTSNYFHLKFGINVQDWIDIIVRYNAPYLSKKQLFKILKIENEQVSETLNGKLFIESNPLQLFDGIIFFLNSYHELVDENDTLLKDELRETILFIEHIKVRLNENNRGSGFTFKTIKKFIEQSIKSLNLSYKGEPLQGLQIMGLLETRCLSFENLIVLNCNEGVLPKSLNNNSYIPFDVRRTFDLPLPNYSDYNFAYNFYRLLQYPKNIYLVYDADSDSLGGGEMSRYISQIKQELNNVKFEEKIALVGELNNSKINEISITKNDEILNDINYYFETKGLTPTAINCYNSCTLKFYFKYIAKLNEYEDTNEFLGADVLGKLAHRILEILYKPFIGKVISANQIILFEKSLSEVSIQACDDIDIKNKIEDGKNLLVINIAKKFVKNFLKAEYIAILNFEKKNHVLTVLSLEHKLESEISILINGELKKIKLTGFADRIDRVGDTIRIIDYKTGNVDERKLSVDDVEIVFEKTEYDKALQLLHYAYLFQSENPTTKNIQSGIVSFRNYKKGILNLMINKNNLLAKPQFEVYEENITKMVNEILNKEITIKQTQDLEFCKICSYAKLCKRE